MPMLVTQLQGHQLDRHLTLLTQMERERHRADPTNRRMTLCEPSHEIAAVPLVVKEGRDVNGIAHDHIARLHIEALPAFPHATIGDARLGESAREHIKGGIKTPGFAVLALARERRAIHQPDRAQPFAHQPSQHLREHPGQPGAYLPQSCAPVSLRDIGHSDPHAPPSQMPSRARGPAARWKAFRFRVCPSHPCSTRGSTPFSHSEAVRDSADTTGGDLVSDERSDRRLSFGIFFRFSLL